MGKGNPWGVNDARSQSCVCAEAWYFWEGDALGTSHLILIITVLEAQVR